MFFKAEILLTQQCNLRCSYCGIIKNPCSDITVDQWKRNFEALKRMGLSFAVLYGGEPTVYPGFEDVVDFLNDIELPYTVITNCTKPVLLERVIPKLPGFTVSIDSPPDLMLDGQSAGSYRKTNNGYQMIEYARKCGVKDITVCITVHKKNLPHLLSMVDYFLDRDIWVITTLIHHSQKTGIYSYRASTNKVQEMVLGKSDLPLLRATSNGLIDRFWAGKKVHNIPAYYRKWVDPVAYRLNWKCNGFQCLSIMPDGTLRPCLDFQGKGIMKQYTVLDLYANKDQLRQTIDKKVAYDMAKCPGCFWDPKWMSSWLLNNKVGCEHGGKIFDHLDDTSKRIEYYKNMEDSQ